MRSSLCSVDTVRSPPITQVRHLIPEKACHLQDGMSDQSTTTQSTTTHIISSFSTRHGAGPLTVFLPSLCSD